MISGIVFVDDFSLFIYEIIKKVMRQKNDKYKLNLIRVKAKRVSYSTRTAQKETVKFVYFVSRETKEFRR